MESYVNELLKNADLTVLTKKHIRLKYKQHVGRELLPEEKSRINDMVYAFVKELSVLEQQKSSPVQPATTPESKRESPGNKENKSHEKSNKFIIKGQVVDKNDLYKKQSSKEKTSSNEKLRDDKRDKHAKHEPDKRKQDKQFNDKPKKKSPEKDLSGEVMPKSAYARAVKMKINDVMSAVLGDAESSSDVSSVSSLSDSSLSEDEVKPDSNMNEALQKLKEARDKKIQMSIEKKKKQNLLLGKTENKARRSLPMKGDRVEELKNSSMVEDSETLSLMSEISAEENDLKAADRLGNAQKSSPLSKGLLKANSNNEVDSCEIRLIKTPENYLQKKSRLLSDKKRLVKIEEKKKKLVKRKAKRLEISSDSESESESDSKHEHIKTKSTSESKKSKDSVYEISDSTDYAERSKNNASKYRSKNNSTDSGKHLSSKNGDSDSSTGNTPLAKKKVKLSKLDSDSEESTGDTPLAKKKVKLSKLDSDSEESTGDTPLAKKKIKSSISKSSTNNTPLIKKKAKTARIASDSEDSTGDTPLAKKKAAYKKDSVEKDSDKIIENILLSEKKKDKKDDSKSSQNQTKVKSKKYVTEIRKTYPKRLGISANQNLNKTPVPESENSQTSSESSSGDISLAQLKKKNASNKSDSAQAMKIKNDSKVKMNVDSVNDCSESVKSDTEESDNESKLNGKVSKKRKLSENSNISTNNTPVSKKKQRKLNVSVDNGKNVSENDLSDSELSDESTGDTPLVTKRIKLRKKSVEGKTSSKTEPEVHKSNNDTQEDVDDADESIVDSSIRSPLKTNTIFDFDGGFESPLKVKKSKGTSLTLESSDSEDDVPSVKVNKQKKSKGKNNSAITKNAEEDSMEEEGTADSDSVIEEASVDSDDSDDIPLSAIKSKTYGLSSDSEDDVPLSSMAAQGKKANTTEEDETDSNMAERTYLRLLRQICRQCQMFVRNDRELAGCVTDKEKIEKLEQMLRDVGMKGKPSLRKAEEVKLQKEAKELSADNIISSETGRVMRKVKSIYARRTISPLKPAKPAMEKPFSGLGDIVDSEGTESSE